MNENLKLAVDEFIHVGVALLFIIALVSLLTGFVRAYIPQEKLQKRLSKTGKYSGVMGAILGIPTPFCSASMVPVSMGMLEMGAPLSMVFSFLLSAPLANFVVVAFIFAVFGLQVAIVYFLIVFIGAIIFGTIAGNSFLVNHIKTFDTKPNNKGCGENTPEIQSCGTTSCSEVSQVVVKSETACAAVVETKTSCEEFSQVNTCSATSQSQFNGIKNEKVREALDFAWSLFKRIMPYVIIGAIISAISVVFVPDTFVENYLGNDNPMAIFLAAVVGVPLYLRIEMAIPLLNVLIGKGMSMGAAMALLIGGTGASLPEIAIVSSMLKPKAVVAFVISIISIAIFGGFIFYYLF